MTVEQIEVRGCDRCPSKQIAKSGSEAETAGWGHIFARALGADGAAPEYKLLVIGSIAQDNPGDPRKGIPADLCPACLEDLMAWWGRRGRHTPVEPEREAKR